MRLRSFLAAAFALLSPAASAQLIVPLVQERSVEGSAAIDLGAFTQDRYAAPGMGPFAESASITVSGMGGLPMGSAEASQVSAIGTDSISASGAVDAETSGVYSDARGLSTCMVLFSVNQPVHYRLFGSLESEDYGFAFVQIRGVGNNVDVSQSVSYGRDLPFDLSGVLQPGSYRFRAFANAVGYDGMQFGFGEASFDTRLDLTAASSIDCVPLPNSTGQPVLINTASQAHPSLFVMDVVGGVPGGFGLMLYGQPQAPTPLGDGRLCIGQPLVRFPAVTGFGAGTSATVELSDLRPPFDAGPGAIAYGSQWTFQFWYRDSGSPLNGFNLSNTLTVTFVP